MAVLFKLQMQFYTEEPGLYSCYHLFDLFVCLYVVVPSVDRFCCILNF